MSDKPTPDVKVSGALPGDWGLRKAQEMHRKHAVRIDEQAERADDAQAAAAERDARREASRLRRAEWKAKRLAKDVA